MRVTVACSWRVAGMLGMGIVYIVVVPWLGYILSIAALILATTYYQGGAINRQVAMVAVRRRSSSGCCSS